MRHAFQELRRVGRNLVNVRVGTRDPNRRRDHELKVHADSLARVVVEQEELEERLLSLAWWPCKNPKAWARAMRKLNQARGMRIHLEARPPA